MAASNIHNSHAATQQRALCCSLSILRGNSHVVADVSLNTVSVFGIDYTMVSVYYQCIH